MSQQDCILPVAFCQAEFMADCKIQNFFRGARDEFFNLLGNLKAQGLALFQLKFRQLAVMFTTTTHEP
jgi:hypothetical protein